MNIYEKMSAIMQDVQYLTKDDQVKFGTTSYKALSEEKVTELCALNYQAQIGDLSDTGNLPAGSVRSHTLM